MNRTSGPFDSALNTAGIWLAEVDDRLLSEDRHVALEAMRAVFPVLRDRLPLEAVLGLSAQTPLIIRGVLLEGWRPQDGPSNLRTVAAFCDAVADRLPRGFPLSALDAVEAVLGTLGDRLDPGEVGKLKAHLPEPLRALWPTPGRAAIAPDAPARVRPASPASGWKPPLRLIVGAGAGLAVLGGLLLWAAWAGLMLSALARSQPLPDPGVGLLRLAGVLLVVGVAILVAVAAERLAGAGRRRGHRRDAADKGAAGHSPPA